MKHPKHLQLTLQELLRSFPWQLYPEIRPNQQEALVKIAQNDGSVILELPVGSGKTAVGFTFLKTLEKRGLGPLFYITPTKTQVEQIKMHHPEVHVAYGRHEHPCLYYPDQNLKADEIPCSFLQECIHRVNQETGETFQPGATPCPYYQGKYLAKQDGIVPCTTAFYLFTQIFSREWDTPAGLVIDEAHRIAQTIRGCLSFEISDYYLERVIEVLREIEAPETKHLEKFLQTMTRIIKNKPPRKPKLLEEDEILDLMKPLMDIDPDNLGERIAAAIRLRKLDPKEKRETLKRLEVVVRDMRRYLHSFEYSLDTKERHPLNYTYAYYQEDKEEGKRVQYRLVVKSYYVAPLIAKRLLSPATVAYSATIGDADTFGYETGIKGPFYSMPSDFSVANTRIFMPTDTANLAVKSRNKRDVTKTIRLMAKSCAVLAKFDIRSLVVVVSNKEREKFLELALEEGVNALSYGNGFVAKDVAARFKAGEGDVLVGTVAHYGEGVDLPKKIAPVIHFFRPGYPNPEDPGTIFEERRHGSRRWRIWNWRVMIEALQVRGRNVRDYEDIGVTIFYSQQFRRFLRAALPAWLDAAYEGEKTVDECIRQTVKLVGKS